MSEGLKTVAPSYLVSWFRALSMSACRSRVNLITLGMVDIVDVSLFPPQVVLVYFTNKKPLVHVPHSCLSDCKYLSVSAHVTVTKLMLLSFGHSQLGVLGAALWQPTNS